MSDSNTDAKNVKKEDIKTETETETETKADIKADTKVARSKKNKAKLPETKPVLVIQNRLLQKILLNLYLPDGTQTGIEINARESREFPWVDSLGPDVESKKAKGYISVFTKNKK